MKLTTLKNFAPLLVVIAALALISTMAHAVQSHGTKVPTRSARTMQQGSCTPTPNPSPGQG